MLTLHGNSLYNEDFQQYKFSLKSQNSEKIQKILDLIITRLNHYHLEVSISKDNIINVTLNGVRELEGETIKNESIRAIFGINKDIYQNALQGEWGTIKNIHISTYEKSKALKFNVTLLETQNHQYGMNLNKLHNIFGSESIEIKKINKQKEFTIYVGSNSTIKLEEIPQKFLEGNLSNVKKAPSSVIKGTELAVSAIYGQVREFSVTREELSFKLSLEKQSKKRKPDIDKLREVLDAISNPEHGHDVDLEVKDKVAEVKIKADIKGEKDNGAFGIARFLFGKLSGKNFNVKYDKIMKKIGELEKQAKPNIRY